LIGETEEGCYIDQAKRDLPYRLQASGSAGNPRRCFELARQAGYKYAGLQHGNECWAGNAVGKYGQTKDSECNMPCAMDNSRNCGATQRNHVYRIPKKTEKADLQLGGENTAPVPLTTQTITSSGGQSDADDDGQADF